MTVITRLLLIAMLCAPSVGWAQAPPTPVLPIAPVGPIDPTKNVLDKVLDAVTRLNDLAMAEKGRSDELRIAEARLRDALRVADANIRDLEVRRLNELRDAETRRINELQAQKQIFDLELARVIRANQESSTLLLAGQLKEVKGDSTDRTAKLEQFANEQRGRASAADPNYLKLVEEVRTLTASRSDLAGRSLGQTEMFAWGMAVLMALLALGGFLMNRQRPVVAH